MRFSFPRVRTGGVESAVCIYFNSLHFCSCTTLHNGFCRLWYALGNQASVFPRVSVGLLKQRAAQRKVLAI